jgi:DNA modification methylase
MPRSEYWSIERLKCWEKNPRAINKDAFENLKAKLRRRKQFKPLIVAEDGTVLGGNMRLRAMQEIGVKEVWVSVLENEELQSEQDRFEVALDDNGMFGYYQEQELVELALEFPDLHLEDFHVHLGQSITLKSLADRYRPTEEDEAPEVDEVNEPIAKLGDIYQLGKHRVMCGDSTQIGDVSELMGGQLVDLMFTDPPYGVSYGDKNEYLNAVGRGNRIQENIKGDTLTPESCKTLWTEAWINAKTVMKSGASFYICSADSDLMMMMMSISDSGLKLKQSLVWVKNNIVLGRRDYKAKHENILYGWNEGAHTFYGAAGEPTVWEVNKPQKNDVHPTMKPIELVAKAVRNSSKGDDNVLDLFGGSGSTLIACEQLGRKCYMMEIDPRYVDVIVKRWSQFTGQEAIKL